MAGVDLGKQVGPLPLGAWMAVVAGGLGIALYTRRQAAPAQTELPVDTSADAGVGTGAVGGFVPTSPGPVAPIAVPTTNDEWGQLVYNGMIAKNYPPTTVDGMVKKYLAGQTSSMSPQEYALLSIALATFGAPPQILPPDSGAPPSTAPPSTGGSTPPPTTKPGLRYVVQIHQISTPTKARDLVKRFSSPSANANQIQLALVRTMADPRNARYIRHFSGTFPAQARIYTTVVI